MSNAKFTNWKIFKLFVTWRMLLFLPLVYAGSLIKFRSGYEYTSFSRIFNLEGLVSHHLLSSWANFDGVHYLTIASHGYVNEAGFFPLFPLIVKAVTFPFTFMVGGVQSYFWVAFGLTNVFFILALVVLIKLLDIDYEGSSVGFWVIIFILSFPTTFFFASIYSESLFLLLLVTTLYFSRRGEWKRVIFFASALSITRLVGVAIYPAILLEFYVQNKSKYTDIPKMIKANIKYVFYLVVSLLPLVGYGLFNQIRWGDLMYFVKAHGQLANSRSVDKIVLFPQTIYRYARILLTIPVGQFEWLIALLEVGMFVLAFYLLLLVWKKKVRASYLIFSFLAFLLPTSSGTFSGLPRYVLILFPIYISLAFIESKVFKICLVTVFVIIQFILLSYFSMGYFIA